MFKPLNIILYFWLLFSAFPIYAQDNFKVFVPEFIPKEGSFEISLTISDNYPEANRLEIYLFPDVSLTINKIELRTEKGKFQIPFHSEFLPEYSEVSQKLSIDLTDTIFFFSEPFFQIIIRLKSERTNSNHLKLYGEFRSDEKILGHLMNSDENFSSDEPNFFDLSFNYFEKYSTPVYAASFTQNSYLNIPLIYNFDETLVAEFWMKLKDYRSTFLQIIDGETNRIEYYLSVNENQMLVVNSRFDDFFQLKPFFISSNVWFHFTIAFNKTESELTFFCNGEEFANINSNNSLAYDNQVLHFEKYNPSGNFSLDQFRLVTTNGSLSGINKNRNYSDYSDDSSRVVLQINFSGTEIENLLSQKKISYEGIKLVQSIAPIFPRAPEIDVKFLNNFYEVDWNGGDYSNADYYILESAIGNNDFMEVGRETADIVEKKTYSLLSEKLNKPEILFFRIKQVNKDGSEVYSDVVKVGQGNIEDIIVGQNYPNPFNPTTSIEFELLLDSDVDIKVFNLEGKEVALLQKGFLTRGTYQFKFDATGLPSGIYLYQISTAYSAQTRKMILAK
jgi:hypothetical protein